MPKTKQTKIEQVTSAAAVAVIGLDEIVPSTLEPQRLRRQRFEDSELEELAASIRSKGLICPITVRPVQSNGAGRGKKKPGFEIVCGERRALASRLAGAKTIQAITRELSDEDALEIQLQENLQRKDPDPLDEAFSFKYLLEKGNCTVHDLSIRFGRTEKNIRQKLKLNDLIPEALKELSDGDLPLGHAREIAKYPPGVQQKIVEDELAYRWQDKNDGAVSLADFKGEIEDEITLKLDAAVFDKSATDLHPEGLACEACPERTGYEPLLFDEELKVGDSCLNKDCFKAKEIRFYELSRERIAEEEKTEPENILPVTDSYHYGKTPFGDTKFEDQVKYLDKPECADSKPSIIFKGERAGQKTYICTNKDCEVHKKQTDVDDSEDQPSDWQLKRMETTFQIDVANKVRSRVLLESLKHFGKKNLFWNNQDLVIKLILDLVGQNSYRLNNYHKEVFSVWSGEDLDWSKESEIKKFVSGLDPLKQTEILFLLTFVNENFSTYDMVPQDGVNMTWFRRTELKRSPPNIRPPITVCWTPRRVSNWLPTNSRKTQENIYRLLKKAIRRRKFRISSGSNRTKTRKNRTKTLWAKHRKGKRGEIL